MEKTSRRDKRISAIKRLYMLDLTECPIPKALQAFSEDNTDPEGEDQPPLFGPEIDEYVKGVMESKVKIDSIISEALTNYSLSRLNLVDRAIIRLAVYELLIETPAPVVINEAIEITKIYSDEGNHKAVSFNNRLLDKIKINLGK